ncbi:MAG: hypothetical protein AB8B91_18955 [Rubripirellula sp.]
MRRVIKVGGSLLLREDLLQALPAWLERQTPAANLLIFGGGEVIDAIRHLDQIRPGDPADTHWMCVGLLDVSFELAARWFDWRFLDSTDDFAQACKSEFKASEGSASSQPILIRVRSFYNRQIHQRESLSLPLDWTTTTDAIAAFLAIETDADELVLLKSCAVDARFDVQQLAQAGIVDEALPGIADRVKSIRVEQFI